MADTRINALTTSTVSVTDDFLPIDGTTAGTKKLSAYSPSFGGNATVGGTLTVNGAGSSAFATTAGFSVSTGITVPSGGVGVGAVGTGGSFYVNTPSLSSSYGSGLAIDGSYPGGTGAQSVVNIKAFGVMSGGGYGSTLSFQTTLNGTFNEVMKLTSGSVVQVLGTAASSSTITGALVVGSGGSGGLGVAGAIVTGGIVRCGGSNGLSLGSDTGNIRIDTAGPAGVEFRGLSSADTVTGFTMREMALIDGTTAPSTRAGYATIYVDTADGDLKVKFGDGTVKTIATDT